MTAQETGIILDILDTAYPSMFSGPRARDLGKTLALWTEIFADDDVAFVAAAVKAFIATDAEGYPPNPGKIKNAMYQLSRRDEMDENQAVELLRRAAANSAYEAEAEFKRLPENLRRLAGSPAQLREWSQMDHDTFNSVVVSHLRRNWRTYEESMRRDALLPGDVRKALRLMTAQKVLGDGKEAGE